MRIEGEILGTDPPLAADGQLRSSLPLSAMASGITATLTILEFGHVSLRTIGSFSSMPNVVSGDGNSVSSSDQFGLSGV